MIGVFEIGVTKEEVLLIDGPAAVKLIAGEMEILGRKINEKNSLVVIRKGKTIPIETPSYVKINIRTQSKQIKKLPIEKAGTHIWKRELSKLDLDKYNKILILGDTDSGKTTLSTFLVNFYFQNKNIAIIDSDVGQNDIAPPGYVALSIPKHPIIDLRELNPNHLRYYGDIKPATNPARLNRIICELSSRTKNRIIINTDGFIKDEGLRIKKELIDKLEPDLIISLGINVKTAKSTFLLISPIRGIIKTKMDRREKRELQYLSFIQRLRNSLTLKIPQIRTFIFGIRIKKLRVLDNKRLGFFLLEDHEAKLGSRDLTHMFVSIEDDRGEEHVAWIKRYNKDKVTLLTKGPVDEIRRLHLGLIRYDGREDILEFIKGGTSAVDTMTFSFNQKGIIE